MITDSHSIQIKKTLGNAESRINYRPVTFRPDRTDPIGANNIAGLFAN